MWFFWCMLVCNLIIPITMIICGRIMWKKPPKNINGIIGYRTARSMKNMDTWNFAHDHCGRMWWKIGWIVLVISAVINFLFYEKSDDIIGIVSAVLCTSQCVVMVVSIFPTEMALKRNFDDNGIRK